MATQRRAADSFEDLARMADSETDLVGGFDGDAELSAQGRWDLAAAALEDDELPRLRRSSFFAGTMQGARTNTRDSCR